MRNIPASKNPKILGYETLPFDEGDISEVPRSEMASAFAHTYISSVDPFKRFPRAFNGSDSASTAFIIRLVKNIFTTVVLERDLVSPGAYALILNDIFEKGEALTTERVVSGVDDYARGRLRSQMRSARRNGSRRKGGRL